MNKPCIRRPKQLENYVIEVKNVLLSTPWQHVRGVVVHLQSRLNLGTRPGRLVSFTPRPLYTRERSPFPMNRMSWPQGRSGWVQKISRPRVLNRGAIGKWGGSYSDLVEKPEGKNPLWRPRLKREYDIKMNLQKIRERAWTRFIWLSTGAGDGLFWRRWWIFRFYNVRRTSWLTEELLATLERLCPVE
jgi:hypothetical protein